MGLLLSALFGILPMLFFAWLTYRVDRYEKEPRLLLGGVFVWGAVIAAGSAFIINSVLGLGIYMFTGSEAATEMTTGMLIAPVVEESLKGFAVLLVFAVFRQEFDSILDGIIYAAIVALGFAASENTYYIYSRGFQESGLSGLFFLAFVRVILVGWQHPFYTAFTGIGLAVARLNRDLTIKLAAPVAGWLAAVMTHAIHNLLADLLSGTGGLVFGTAVDWIGWIFMLVFVLWTVAGERRTLEEQLREEVSLGSITADQYRIACSSRLQNNARLKAVFAGLFGPTDRFYQLCGELAHKKKQYLSLGDEHGNQQIIASLRRELAQLSVRLQS